MKQQTRIDSLDYLRGLAALAIMVYHYLLWTTGRFDVGHLFGKLGIYGVSLFYILSGLTLYIVYSKSLEASKASLAAFFIKRVCRIFPLLWLVVMLSLPFEPEATISKIAITLTGAFGFIAPAKSIGVGTWSIGNELFFYAFFPILILLAKHRRNLFFVAVAALMLIGLYFAFFRLDDNLQLSPQWYIYINPLNQIWLFSGGITIGYLFKNYSPNRKKEALWLLVLVLSLAAFVWHPVSGSRINIVADWNRVFFVTVSFMICLSVYLSNIEVSYFVHRPLSLLGEISYGIYLLHPVVFYYMLEASKTLRLPVEYVLVASVLFTLLASYLSYKFYERKFILLGKTLANRVHPKVDPEPYKIIR